jgi:DNA primase RepB-like protein/CHC2-type zinc finger protein
MTGAEVTVGGRAATRRFLAALYRSAPAGSLVEVRYSVASGMRRRFHRVEETEGVVDEVAGRARWTDVFVGVVPRRRRGGRRDDLVARASVVWVDCDSDESVAALAVFRSRPAIKVASGSAQNRHAYWFLRDAVGLDVVEQLNRRLALALGADARCSDAARILRPAGSTNRKSGRAVAVRLIAVDEQRSVGVAELDRRLPALPAEPAEPAEPQRWSPRAAGEDRLLAVSPRVYVERLTGAPIGRSGKMRCPLHEDRTPSLHVYEDPQRGWYCFGC